MNWAEKDLEKDEKSKPEIKEVKSLEDKLAESEDKLLRSLAEIENQRKFNAICFYKDQLYHEPEFIGINNISSSDILYIIENTQIACKLCTKDHKLTNDQIRIFDNMYIELFGNKYHINIYNTVTKRIFEKIYIKHNYMIRNFFYPLDNVSKMDPEYL